MQGVGAGLTGMGGVAGSPMAQPNTTPIEQAEAQDTLDDTVPASPEEQAAYDQFVKTAQAIVYPPGQGKVQEQILNNLRGNIGPELMQMFAEADPPLAPNPLDALAATAVMLVIMVEGTAEQSGVDIPDDVVLHAGAEIVEDLIEVAEAARIHEFSEEDIERITYRASSLYGVAAPRVNQEALSAEFEQIVSADRAGQLGAVLPGVDKRRLAEAPSGGGGPQAVDVAVPRGA